MKRETLCGTLRQRAIALDEALGRHVTWNEVANALAWGFAEALDLDLVPGDLSPYELSTATHLQACYAGDEWTYSR